MMYACILTLVMAVYLVAAAPGDLSYAQWFEIEPSNEINPNIVGKSWELFKAKYNKIYASTKEEAYRRFVFTENLKEIELHNQKYKKGEKSYWLGLNQFSDLIEEEFTALHSGYDETRDTGVNSKDNMCSQFIPHNNVTLPDTFDWRQKGFAIPVKDQLHCGSCWAFSAIGSLEGQIFLKTGKLVSLSEQQLVDCVDNQGCCGNSMHQAYKYISQYGIETDEAYQYNGMEEECKYNPSKTVAKDIGCVNIKRGCESSLQKAVATIGPISVAIDASLSKFHHYEGGVFEEKSCSRERLNHAVVAVGYGSEYGKDYWLVKNSWGKSWGENGYMKVARNEGNMCGIATMASYPLV